ncbi:hypothetical protein NDU88_007330 [Pleurodeles waltl]|uniref:Uncharacterized protein n=1 Tax=Pleurodeles waltl TaxID=8319 RepID=A0AAV7U024_PLEWA|nr:hypothetical protein NDU88_007330 [Pleurodeles waltl]
MRTLCTGRGPIGLGCQNGCRSRAASAELMLSRLPLGGGAAPACERGCWWPGPPPRPYLAAPAAGAAAIEPFRGEDPLGLIRGGEVAVGRTCTRGRSPPGPLNEASGTPGSRGEPGARAQRTERNNVFKRKEQGEREEQDKKGGPITERGAWRLGLPPGSQARWGLLQSAIAVWSEPTGWGRGPPGPHRVAQPQHSQCASVDFSRGDQRPGRGKSGPIEESSGPGCVEVRIPGRSAFLPLAGLLAGGRR